MQNYSDLFKKNPKQDLLERYAGIQKSINNLYQTKYGYGNKYDPSRGWSNQGNAQTVNGWDDLKEQQGLSQYNKLNTDLSNTQNALNEYNLIEKNRANNMAQSNVVKEQAEKYLPQQLQMQGLGQVGTSESSLLGIGNNYQKNINDISMYANEQNQDLLRNYQNAMQESDLNLSNQQADTIANYQDVNFNNAAKLLERYNNKEDLDRVLNQYKGQVSQNQFKVLEEFANSITSAGVEKTNAEKNVLMAQKDDIYAKWDVAYKKGQETGDYTEFYKLNEQLLAVIDEIKKLE